MSNKAVGCLEVLGYSVALDAMDKACKGADIKILGIDCNNPRAGDKAKIPNVFQVKFEGDISSVRNALDIAREVALKYIDDEDIFTHCISKKADGVDELLSIGKVKKK
jgi:microcompartment protein CcmL/EutN